MHYDGFYRIQKAEYADSMDAAGFYENVCIGLEKGVNYPHWEKGVYPSEDDIYPAIERKELYLARDGIRIVGGFVLAHRQPTAYAGVDWGCELPRSEVRVIEKFASLPACKGRHVGQLMMDYILALAKEEGIRALRLEVVPDNAPAIRLYKRNGFEEKGTVDLGLGMYGLPQFKVFQRPV